MAQTPSPVGPTRPLPAQGLLVEVEDLRASTRRRLRVSGELDLATVRLFQCAIDRAADDSREVEVDLSGVAFCDVIGATAIERAQQQLQDRGRHLILHGVDGPLRLLLAVEGLFRTLRPSARLGGEDDGETAVPAI